MRATGGRAAAVGPSRARARRLRGDMTVRPSPYPNTAAAARFPHHVRRPRQPGRPCTVAQPPTTLAQSRPAPRGPVGGGRPPLVTAPKLFRYASWQSFDARRRHGGRADSGEAPRRSVPLQPRRSSANPDVVRTSSGVANAPAPFPYAGSRLLPCPPPTAHRSRMSPICLFSASRRVPFAPAGVARTCKLFP